jgi:5-(carboxyamino)imidazole ribonucleotide synthase
MNEFRVVTPPAMLGLLGGGQLGRYFVIEAKKMGYGVTVVDPSPDAPAGQLADVHIVAPYDDPAALEQLAATCAVVTVEFENAPAEGLTTIADRTLVHPPASALAITQDRIKEKEFLLDIGAPVGPYIVIETEADAEAAVDFEYPAILKTARNGYDGKGQFPVWNHGDLAGYWSQLGNVPCVLEKKFELDRELSMVLARTADDRVITYPVAQNTHVSGILDTSFVPAVLPGDGATAAAQLCSYIARELDFVGVMCVEMFVVGNDVFVNELAPRPHNTGHYTLNVCTTSQFEQQVRAICGLGLGETRLLVPGVAMVNLLGEMWERGEPKWARATTSAAAHLHLYGKSEPRRGRKMGHLTVATGTAMGARAIAYGLRNDLIAD